MNVRRYTFKLYPSAAQDETLRQHARMAAELWNALLQRQEDIYRRTRGQKGVVHADGRSRLTFFDMTAEITQLRQACPEWAALSVWTAHRVAKSLDDAFKAFFARAKKGAGAQSGYPRFKSTYRATRIPHRFASGCRLTPRERSNGADKSVSARTWTLTLKGVPGAIRARGELPGTVIKWTDADIMFRDGAWWLSIAVDIARERHRGEDAITVRFDLIDEFARVERVEGRRTACGDSDAESARKSLRNPRGINGMQGASGHPGNAEPDVRGPRLGAAHRRGLSAGHPGNAEPDVRGDRCRASRARAASSGHPGNAEPDVLAGRLARAADLCNRADDIKSQRDLRYPRKPFTRPSRRYLRETERASRLLAKAARIRREALHEWSTAIIRSAGDLTIIAPAVKDETRTPRGNEREWGANVATVSALNRNTLNQAPAMAKQMLIYKAAEAGIRCDVLTDDAPAIAVGSDLVTTGKLTRKATRKLRKAA